MRRFGIDEQISCVLRELKMRLRVYPRLVSNGKMTQAKADQEILAMEAVLDTLKTIKEGREPSLL